MDKHTELLKKAEEILKSNIYISDKFLWGKYRMISPCQGDFPDGFPGVWNWDSAFHAIGMLDFDKEIAKEQITGFLQFQKADGMLPDVIFENGTIEDRLTKPPVMADAAWRVYKATGDKEFLRQVYPKFVKNEEFWVNKRMVDGLFHYDADVDHSDTELCYRLVGYESGWDNSPRWDNEPYNYHTVDLNCYMVTMYRALDNMAKELGLHNSQWHKKEKAITDNIETRLWDEEQGAYVDYNFARKEFSHSLSPASFMPLYVGIASAERAEKMNIIAKKHFLPGMPTIAYDDQNYSTDYWRGPCWLNVAYFAAKGLKDYGFTDTADTIRDTILDWVYNDGEYIHENYDATTGKGLRVSRFSWSCVFIREFINNF